MPYARTRRRSRRRRPSHTYTCGEHRERFVEVEIQLPPEVHEELLHVCPRDLPFNTFILELARFYSSLDQVDAHDARHAHVAAYLSSLFCDHHGTALDG